MSDDGAARGVVVPTYRGPVAAGDLGPTLTHEHLFVRDPQLDRDYPHPEWDEDAAVETAVAGLEDLFDQGVRTVVDLTVPGLGRDVGLVARVAARVRIHLIAATGWYTDTVLPNYFRTHGEGRLVGGPDPLPQMFLRDVTEGIGGSGVRAGMLKVVSDTPGLTPDVTRVMEAAAEVHVQTGVPITTHSNPSLRGGLGQLALLTGRGVDPQRVVVGHSGDSDDLDYLRQLMDTGAFAAFDRFGMAHVQDDETRIITLLRLLKDGYADRLLLSHDTAYFSRVTPPSWRRRVSPLWTHDHLSRRVLPQLLARGASHKDIDLMMIDNPRRLLAFAPRTP
ncbi:phosphotriesterase family protein [Aeromicrobium sp. CF3.5]|uniref:phosphotriesterase family protein n=1 Tax=Aeromicrobium sp. CF3.5 TaxID=3373078 RepID=UPI003EE6EFD5